jgi:integrase
LLMRRPIERWGTRRLDTLQPSDVETFFREREREGAKQGTLERERVLLKQCFNAAIADKLLETNPLRNIRVFKTSPKTRVMTADEESLIRTCLPGKHWDRYLTIALGTGLRAMELHALRPCDLRQDGTWIEVRGDCNKTGKSRMVPLRPEVKNALVEQAASRNGDDATPYFAEYHIATPKTMLARICRELKIPRISIHDLRRTFATRCAQGGMYPKHLQLILGHSKIETTMRFYVHLEQVTVLEAIRHVNL